jgi:hypothetical protein
LGLKLPAAERAGNLHRKEYHLFLICSLIPPQAAGNALAFRFNIVENTHEKIFNSFIYYLNPFGYASGYSFGRFR